SAKDGSGVVVHNSEYMHVDDSACNLASLNLMKFRREDGTFDVQSFEHAVDIMLLAQEIIVAPSSYPTEAIARNARGFRQLGLGYANLGAYLMSDGVPYDSDAGRGTAAAITALMTARAYEQSAHIATALGPYQRYAENREAHNEVMRMHRDAAYAIPDDACADEPLLAAARRSWDGAVELGERHGYRNAQASTLAPTGTISFLMDCDTTGVERAISHTGHLKMIGAVQPFVSGAISKTVNLPETATVDDIADAYNQAWHLGIKALAIYRDGSKTAQALRTDAQQDAPAPADVDAIVEQAVTKALEEAGPQRRRMPRERQSITHKFSIGSHEGYI